MIFASYAFAMTIEEQDKEDLERMNFPINEVECSRKALKFKVE